MSGGKWGYQQHRIREVAEEVQPFFNAIAETEKIIDWSESGDTNEQYAKDKLYELWHDVFDQLWGRGDDAPDGVGMFQISTREG